MPAIASDNFVPSGSGGRPWLHQNLGCIRFQAASEAGQIETARTSANGKGLGLPTVERVSVTQVSGDLIIFSILP